MYFADIVYCYIIFHVSFHGFQRKFVCMIFPPRMYGICKVVDLVFKYKQLLLAPTVVTCITFSGVREEFYAFVLSKGESIALVCISFTKYICSSVYIDSMFNNKQEVISTYFNM